MKKLISITAVLALMIASVSAQQVFPERLTGFSNFRIYMDPGHSGFGNAGYGGYSEAEKNLDVAFYIKEFLMMLTDMPAENFMFSRTTHSQAEIAFSMKADQAYAFGADMYFSPHSDAGGITAITTLMLYGGRRLTAGAAPIEKLPEGGKRLGEFLTADMTSAMRIIRDNAVVNSVGTRGNINDLIFFNAGGVRGPWLAVHSQTNNRTASILTEAGFHTNPTQNMQFTNRQHRRMQAYTNAQSIIRWWTERQTGTAALPPQLGIATGFVFDSETARFINGATITVTEPGKTPQVYVTDTWESLQAFLATLITVGPAGQVRPPFTFNPATFGNGFWWLEGFTPGATLDVKVEAQGFQPVETTVTVPLTAGAITQDGLASRDISMLNIMPPVVTDVTVTRDHTNGVIVNRPMTIRFDRRMIRPTVESALSITLAGDATPIPVTLNWVNDFTLNVNITSLSFETDYVLTIAGTAQNSQTNQYLAGADGVAGSDFVWNFTTQETAPPAVVSFDPQGDQEMQLRPIVRLEFDRPIAPASIGANQLTVRDADGVLVAGRQEYREINGRGVLHFFFNADLANRAYYTVTLAAGVTDMTGVAKEDDFVFTFLTRARPVSTSSMLEEFPTLSATGGRDWRQPEAAGQTQGQVLATTTIASVTDPLPGVGTNSLRINYQWREAAPIRELRLNSFNLTNSVRFQRQNTNYLQYYIFGDGSHTRFSVVLREATGTNAAAGTFFSHQVFEIDWIGWRRITWDLSNYVQSNAYIGGTDYVPYDRNMIIQSLRVLGATGEHASLDPSTFWVSRIEAVQLGDIESYTVTFNTDGGTAVNPREVFWGGKISRPTTTQSGYTFLGWFTDVDAEHEWDFVNDRVFEDITLYAAWEVSQEVPVTFSVVGTGGTLIAETAIGEFNSGDNIETGTEVFFTAVPDPGQQVKEWTVNGEVVAGNATNYLSVEVLASLNVTVEFEAAVGFDDIHFANLKLYPNPIVSEVTIIGARNSTLEIVNLLGAIIKTQAITHDRETIQLNDLSSGVYFFRVSRDGQSRTVQVIKR